MFVQMRKMVVKEGNADQVVKRFSGEGIIERQDGFSDLSVIVKKVRRGDEEVIINWSEAYLKQWEKSEAHIAGHKANLGKPKPEYIVSSEGSLYEVKAIKKAVDNLLAFFEFRTLEKLSYWVEYPISQLSRRIGMRNGGRSHTIAYLH